MLYCERKLKMEQKKKRRPLNAAKHMLVCNGNKDLNGIRICTIIHKPSPSWQNKPQLFNSATRGYTTECISIFQYTKISVTISIPKPPGF